MTSFDPADPRSRLVNRATAWRVAIERILETENSVVAFGRRDDRSVVLKVGKRSGDERLSATVIRAFGGNGMVRIIDDIDGALLLERLTPGHSLVTMVTSGHDDDATEALTDVIRRMTPQVCPSAPTVEDWGHSFERYRALEDRSLPETLVEEAHRVYHKLSTSQRRRRLLHGDLHHGNVLLDSDRGWLAIDPKGVVGEAEYEIGAALRNPIEKAESFLQLETIRARVECFADRLHLDADRILAWAFAQAVLSAVWLIEDGFVVDDDHPWLQLARSIRPLLKRP
jgi:streptomycin 6-kinase